MESILSQVSAWSYAFAAVLHGLFALYLGVAWRRGRQGILLIAAVVARRPVGGGELGVFHVGLGLDVPSWPICSTCCMAKRGSASS